MKRKRVNLKIVLGFTLATTLALGGLVAADVVINPDTIVAKADEAEDIVFDFTETNNEVSQETIADAPEATNVETITQEENNPPVTTPEAETPPAENPDPETSTSNPASDSEETLNPDALNQGGDNTTLPDSGNGNVNNNPTENNSGNGTENENIDDSLLPGEENGITPPDVGDENPDVNNPDEHIHSICYTALDETTHIMTCTDAECEYAQTEDHSNMTEGEICICGFQMTVIPGGGDNETEQPDPEVPDIETPSVVTQEEYNKVKEQVAQLEQKINELEKKQKKTSSSSLSDSSSSTSSQVSSLNNQVSTLQSQNTTLNNKNNTMAADLSSLQSQVSSLTGKLNNLSNTYAAGNTNNTLSQTGEDNRKAQVGDIQNLIDSDTYPAQDILPQTTYSDTFDGINTNAISSDEVTFDFTSPADVNAIESEESEEAINKNNVQTQTTSVTSDTAYTPFNGMPINSLVNTKATRERAMAAAATVGTISFSSMIGLYIYGRKKGLFGKKEISIDDLINDEEKTGSACPV